MDELTLLTYSVGKLPEAASDLKAALRLRPNEPAVEMALNDLARRANAANIDLEPVAPTAEFAGLSVGADGPTGGDTADDGAEEVVAGGEPKPSEPMATSTPAGGGGGPAVGTRSAARLKADADAAFKNGKLDHAIGLYGRAMQADSQSVSQSVSAT